MRRRASPLVEASGSALYVGRVRHRRHAPRAHRLAYPLFMVYADLDELPTLFRGSRLASARRPALAWLRRGDYSVGDPALPWAEAVRRWAADRLGRRLGGPVRLLTNPRTLGFRMNPVSFYYLYGDDDVLEAVAAEVTSTPWDERHVYLVDGREAGRRGAAWQVDLDKRLHVSPFFPMDLRYRWRLIPPGRRLLFHMESRRDGKRVFDATLALSRRPLTPANLRRLLLGRPALTLRIFVWIYLHAALLKLKGVPFHSHPGGAADGDAARAA